MSLCAYIDTQLAAPAPEAAALKRPVWVMILLVMCPPALQPILAMRSPSTRPSAMRWSTPVITSRWAWSK